MVLNVGVPLNHPGADACSSQLALVTQEGATKDTQITGSLCKEPGWAPAESDSCCMERPGMEALMCGH